VTPMQVDIRVPLGRPLTELADFAVRCEQAALGGVGVPDHHHTGRDLPRAEVEAFSEVIGPALRDACSTNSMQH
jgi:hypothetical protein